MWNRSCDPPWFVSGMIGSKASVVMNVNHASKNTKAYTSARWSAGCTSTTGPSSSPSRTPSTPAPTWGGASLLVRFVSRINANEPTHRRQLNPTEQSHTHKPTRNSNAYNFPAIRAAFAQAYARLHNLILHPPHGNSYYKPAFSLSFPLCFHIYI